jgi:hypothetical protein
MSVEERGRGEGSGGNRQLTSLAYLTTPKDG